MDDPGDLAGRLERRSSLADWTRLRHYLAIEEDRKDHSVSTSNTLLENHVAVKNHGKGVGSEHLANFVECFANYGGTRIMGTGRLQYELGGTNDQRFEGLSGQELCDELLEELSDASNYLAFIAIKVLAVRNTLADV